MHSIDGDGDNGYDKNGNKINDNGGETTDTMYNDDGSVFSTTKVSESGSLYAERGYGYKWNKLASGACSEDNTIANFFTGGAVAKGIGGVFSTPVIANKFIGIGSKLFGNSVVRQGSLNVTGRFVKAGWSTYQNSKGAWGYGIRIGVGNSVNANIALRHFYVRATWTANEIANPIIKTLR